VGAGAPNGPTGTVNREKLLGSQPRASGLEDAGYTALTQRPVPYTSYRLGPKVFSEDSLEDFCRTHTGDCKGPE
jgi:hypothetical protein